MKGISTIIWLQLLGSISAVTAISPRFQNANGDITATGDLVVTWKETGLGNNQNIQYSITGDASSTWACINNAQKNPKASNKQTVSEPITQFASANSGNNGQVTDSVTVDAPLAPSGFSCPPGQDEILGKFSYTNVVITNTTNNIHSTVGTGTFTKTFFNLKKQVATASPNRPSALSLCWWARWRVKIRRNC